MDKSDLFAMLDIEASPAKTKSKKRKWREIEALQDRYKLEKELAELDCGFEYEARDTGKIKRRPPVKQAAFLLSSVL